jgi:hypothetical protein
MLTKANVRPRITVFCDAESFHRLAEIGKRWLSIIAAQQSNLVREAEAQADARNRPAPAQLGKFRGHWEAANNVDAARLRSLCQLWPELGRSTQVALVETAKAVAGF